MKVKYCWLVNLFILSLGSNLLAVTEPASANPPKGKYAVIDMQAVILAVDEGKTARAELEAEIKKKEGEFKKKQEELDTMNKEWKSQAAVLSESARFEKQQKFQEKFLEYKNAEQAFQAEIKQKEQQATQKIAVNVAQMVQQLGKEAGYDAVFETNSAGLLYLKDPVDITKEVIASYTKKAKEFAAKSGDKKTNSSADAKSNEAKK